MRQHLLQQSCQLRQWQHSSLAMAVITAVDARFHRHRLPRWLLQGDQPTWHRCPLAWQVVATMAATARQWRRLWPTKAQAAPQRPSAPQAYRWQVRCLQSMWLLHPLQKLYQLCLQGPTHVQCHLGPRHPCLCRLLTRYKQILQGQQHLPSQVPYWTTAEQMLPLVQCPWPSMKRQCCQHRLPYPCLHPRRRCPQTAPQLQCHLRLRSRRQQFFRPCMQLQRLPLVHQEQRQVHRLQCPQLRRHQHRQPPLPSRSTHKHMTPHLRWIQQHHQIRPTRCQRRRLFRRPHCSRCQRYQKRCLAQQRALRPQCPRPRHLPRPPPPRRRGPPRQRPCTRRRRQRGRQIPRCQVLQHHLPALRQSLRRRHQPRSFPRR